MDRENDHHTASVASNDIGSLFQTDQADHPTKHHSHGRLTSLQYTYGNNLTPGSGDVKPKLSFFSAPSPADLKSKTAMKEVREMAMNTHLKDKGTSHGTKVSGASRPNFREVSKWLPNAHPVQEALKANKKYASSSSETIPGTFSKSHIAPDVLSCELGIPETSPDSRSPQTKVITKYLQIRPKPFQSIGIMSNPFETAHSTSYPPVSMEKLKLYFSRVFRSSAMETHWIPTLLNSSGAFFGTLLMASTHYDAIHNLPFQSPHTIVLFREVCFDLAESLRDLPSRMDKKNIITITTLIASDIIRGNDENLRIHRSGAEAFVRRKIELQELDCGHASTLSWLSLQSSILQEQKPNPLHVSYCESTPLDPNCSRESISESPLFSIGSDPEVFQRSARCTPSTLELLSDIQTMLELVCLEQGFGQQRPVAMIYLYRQIIQCPPAAKISLTGTLSVHEWMYEAVRVTAVIQATAIIQRISLSKAIVYIWEHRVCSPTNSCSEELLAALEASRPETLLSNLKTVLDNTNLADVWEDMAAVLLWIALVIGAASHRSDKVLRNWFCALAVRTSILLGFDQPEAVRATMLRMSEFIGAVEYPVELSNPIVDNRGPLLHNNRLLQSRAAVSPLRDDNTNEKVVKADKIFTVTAGIHASPQCLSLSVPGSPHMDENKEESGEDHTLSMTDDQYSAFDDEYVYQPSASDGSNISSSSPTSSISWSSTSQSLFSITGLVISTKTRIIDDLMREFYYTMQNFTHSPVSAGTDSKSGNKSSSTTTQASSSQHKGKGRLKRTFEDEQPPDDEDGDGSNKRRETEKTADFGEEKRCLRFACPFFKRNPRGQKCTACRYPGFTAMHRMKEHLYRNHLLVCCHRCHRNFNGDADLREHQREVEPCAMSRLERPEGIDTMQLTRLKSKKRFGKERTEEEKWRAIYQFLFPEEDSSLVSPYCDDVSAPQDINTPLTEYEILSRRIYPRRLRQALDVRFDQLSQPIADQLRNEIVDIAQQTRVSLYTEFQELRAVSGPSIVLQNPLPEHCDKMVDQEADIYSPSGVSPDPSNQGPVSRSLYYDRIPIEISEISERSHDPAVGDPALEPFDFSNNSGENWAQSLSSAFDDSSAQQDLVFNNHPVSEDYSSLSAYYMDIYASKKEDDRYQQINMSWLENDFPAF